MDLGEEDPPSENFPCDDDPVLATLKDLDQGNDVQGTGKRAQNLAS